MYTFEKIKGNNLIVNLFQDSIFYNSINHCYIIDGEKGSGKTLLAKSFAKTLLCENSDVNPCMTCPSCLSFDSDNNPDIFYIENKDGKSIGADIIRDDINETVLIKPFKYKYKIYLIENFNTLTVPAQNAFLKTLEEPPSYVIFLLMTTNHNDMLPTILSRSVVLKIKPISESLVFEYLTENYDRPDLLSIASISNGNIGSAINYIEDELFLEKRNTVLSIIKKVIVSDLVETTLLYEHFTDYLDDLDNILNLFLAFYRDILIYKNTKNIENIIQKDKLNDIIELEQKFSEKNLLKKIQSINNSIEKLKHNTNKQMTIELLLLKLKEI